MTEKTKTRNLNVGRMSRSIGVLTGALIALLAGLLLPMTPASAVPDPSSNPTLDIAPARVMTSDGFNYPDYISAPGDGFVYVSDRVGNTVTVFDAAEYGSGVPVRTIPTRAGALGIAVANGLIYVAARDTGEVDVYEAGGAGTSNTKVRTIATGFGAIAVDGVAATDSEVFVAFNGLGRVHVFRAGGAGTPNSILRSVAVSLPKGVAVSEDNLFVARGYGDTSSIEVFPRTWTGSPSAIRSITGSSVVDPYGVTVADYRGRSTLLVANRAGNSVVAFDPGASGTATPRLRLAGPATELASPTGIAVVDQTQLFVSNSQNPKRVAMFTESPYITAVDPAAGFADTDITISGLNFTDATGAAVGDTATTNTTVASDTAINARVAAATPDLYDVSVTSEYAVANAVSVLIEEATTVAAELPAADSVQMVVSAPDGVVSLGDSTGLSAPPGYPVDFTGTEIAFRGTREAVNNAIATLQFTSSGGDNARFDVSAAAEFDGLNFNPDNGHYYEFVTGNQTWAAAREAAKARTFNGLNGYLANVTSAEENAFVTEKTGGSAAWIGGSDIEVEGSWKWMDGPEAGTEFWTPACGRGLVGLCDETGGYSAWYGVGAVNVLPAEPNNAGSERALQIPAGGTGRWNNLPHDRTSFLPMIVEYSEADGSAVAGLSANRSLDLILRETTTRPASFTTFTVPAPPVVTAVAADEGRPGNTVTISGTGFTDATAVTFDGAPATFTVDSDTSITANVPLNEVIIADVAVSTAYGSGTLTGGFTYLDVPNDETLCVDAPALVNGDFEDYQPPTWSDGTFGWVVVPQTTPGIGWKNTGVYLGQPDGIELHKGIRYGAASGEISGELNAHVAGTFYQEVATVPGTTMRWRLAHGSHTDGVTNTMRMLFGPDLDNLVQSGAEISSDQAAWNYHTGTYTVPAGQTTTIFALQAVTGGDVGNLVDDISYTLDGCAAPPKNLDYLPAPGRARISFTPGDDGGNPVQRYAYSVDGGPWLPVTPDGDTVTIPGLTNHRDHSVRLRPINGFSAGDISDPIIVRPTDRPPVPRLVTRSGNALQWAEPNWAGNDDLTTYTVVYKKWEDRNNPRVRWAIYARRTTPIEASLPLQVEMNATRRNCGPENTALGWNNCPLPIGALDPSVEEGYAFRVFTRTATKFGPMSAPVQYIP
jgi:hypothetical protein